MSQLIIALSKGRILKDTLPLLKVAGIELLEDPDKSRKLIFPTTHPQVNIIIIRATDVPTYVENGAADIGVAGKDVLMEHGASGVYEPLDLNIAKCKLMVAGKVNAPPVTGRLRVATKFVNLTKQYYAQKGEQVEVIKLYGSMELAPLMGLADRIVDVVDTGKTLKENGLEALELISHVSSRLIVNKASFKRKADLIQPLLQQLSQAITPNAEG
ncbi:MAG: ATP phosphoribosyltransferase [Agitococcus sp.]|jgi:ATP phosphoribosyltransferase|nr:ATP phosphoribosyltransferase [Moraxellaceae bacterium]MBK9186490.1 ATP phosphoribosyltransferase [Moraxellaceae bacterium]MBL0229923.1 ATP phosphoribosyltransferase [Moraxellaceae bacterium]MBP9216478.1 ATP phosphoribosyltransferase [Agitococcus sp.]HQV79712.1 ATP phosphoribosyltransferase [Agitococcus sp.]